MVSRCCLKFLSNSICSYWMKDAFIKMTSASAQGTAAPERAVFLTETIFPFLFLKKVQFYNLFLWGSLFYL